MEKWTYKKEAEAARDKHRNGIGGNETTRVSIMDAAAVHCSYMTMRVSEACFCAGLYANDGLRSEGGRRPQELHIHHGLVLRVHLHRGHHLHSPHATLDPAED